MRAARRCMDAGIVGPPRRSRHPSPCGGLTTLAATFAFVAGSVHPDTGRSEGTLKLPWRQEGAVTLPADTLGGSQNPVKAAGPPGQREYLNRLRCANGKAPQYYRIGNVGIGVNGTVVDKYSVDCGPFLPGRVIIYMDMYHDHVELRPVDGFGIGTY